jgi:PEP-CTERM motif-containing protein
MTQIRLMNRARQSWLGCGAAAALCLAVASPATARPISTDSIHTLDITSSACALSSCTAPSDLGLGTLPANYFDGVFGENVTIDTLSGFDKLYIYRDGIVSFGSALPAGATLGDASTLGHSFAAPGFDAFAGDSIDVEVALTPERDSVGDPTGGLAGIGIYWIINDANIFGMTIGSDPCSTGFNTCFYYGSPEFSWFKDDATDPFLPDGALVGFPGAMHTVGAGLTIDLDTAIQGNVSLSGGAVPEPSAWALMILGFGALGAAFRRRRVLVGAPI